MPALGEGSVRASVIVPTHNRPARLRVLLQSLASQSLSATDFEVIVVDDGSTSSLMSASDLLAEKNQRIYRQAKQGPAAARNTGAKQSRGNLLVFIDDDCVAHERWLEALLNAHKQATRVLFGGQTLNGLPDNIFSCISESLLAFFDEESLRAGNALTFVASNNLACSRELFLSIEGFDEKFPLAAGEDRDFCQRWFDHHWTMQRCADAQVKHYHALSFSGFMRQHYNYGRGAAQFHAKHPLTKSLPASFGFYLRLIVHPLTRYDWPLWKRLLGVPVTLVSQCAVAIGRFDVTNSKK